VTATLSTSVVAIVLANPRLSTSSGHRLRPEIRSTIRVRVISLVADGSDVRERAEIDRLAVACEGALAANVVALVREGDRVLATGDLKQRSWTASSRQPRSQWILLADECGVALSTDYAPPDEWGDEEDRKR
jgi:hypothetical protein